MPISASSKQSAAQIAPSPRESSCQPGPRSKPARNPPPAASPTRESCQLQFQPSASFGPANPAANPARAPPAANPARAPQAAIPARENLGPDSHPAASQARVFSQAASPHEISPISSCNSSQFTASFQLIYQPGRWICGGEKSSLVAIK
ncbi:hypothetical protein TIFTF001_045804 [Ficus carica]|uniref:Uncharacterized protein n=1 Tax=Ficus carica TaxID=3494 RepID=A0AA87YU99_FICCA|nr:hypothetical protein TIFTF001_045804 [Ficus carica]